MDDANQKHLAERNRLPMGPGLLTHLCRSHHVPIVHWHDVLVLLAVLHSQANPGREGALLEQVAEYPIILCQALLVERAAGLLPLCSDLVEGDESCGERENCRSCWEREQLGWGSAEHRPVRSRAALSISAFWWFCFRIFFLSLSSFTFNSFPRGRLMSVFSSLKRSEKITYI